MKKKSYKIYVAENDMMRKFDINEFRKKEITVGTENADILVESNSISKIHLSINILNDKIYFADMDSTAGTYIYNNNEFVMLESMKYYKKSGQDTVLRLSNDVILIISESEYLKVNVNKGITIGRNRENDIVLKHFGVFPRHAQILPAEKGNIDMLYVFFDTFVNREVVENEQVLRNSDYIQILGFTMIYFNNFLIYKKGFEGANIELHNVIKKKTDDVSLRIDSNEFTAIIGDNGSLINVMRGSSKGLKSGEAYINGLDILKNDVMKEIVGYVPKEHIIYEELTISSAIKYSMELRNYEDVEEKFIDRQIDSVLDMLGIIEFKDTKFKELEEDIKKRADIALEIAGNPSLMIIDGQTANFSEEMLYLLKSITMTESKTVVVSLKKIKNPELFDRIIFIGAGGKICFSGNINEAKMFFDTESLTEMLNMIKENQNEYAEQYKKYFSFNETQQKAKSSKTKAKINYRKQFGILLKRNFEILLKSNIFRLIMILIQPIAFGILTCFFCKDSRTEMFILSLAAVWLGIFNSIGEFYKEKYIFLREKSRNLKIFTYLSSKYVTQLVIAFVQSVLIAVTAIIFSDILFIDVFLRLLTIILTSSVCAMTVSVLLAVLLLSD